MKLVQEGDENNTVLVKLVNPKDELANCLSMRLVSVSEEGGLTVQKKEGVIERNKEKTLLAHEYSRFII